MTFLLSYNYILQKIMKQKFLYEIFKEIKWLYTTVIIEYVLIL